MNEPTTKALRVIHLDDNARDRELVALTLAVEGVRCQIIQARTRAEFEAALDEQNLDLVLCDFTVPSYGGTAALAAVRKLHPELPFIFVSGTIGEERAVESLRSGATDYVLKDQLKRLVPVVRRALHEAGERQNRQQAERRIYELNLLLRAIREIHRLIARERDPERLLAAACRSLVQTRGYRFAWVGLVCSESKRVAATGCAGEGADYLEAAPVTWDETATGQGPTGTAIRTGQPWICQNTATDPRFAPWREAALVRGFASVAAAPMLREGRALGAITVYSAQVDAFHDEELGLLHELAGDLAYALENIDYERRRKHAEASMERSHAEMAAIYDALPLMTCLVNPGRQVEHVNRTMVEFLGAPPALAMPLHPGELLGCLNALESPRGCGFGQACEICPLNLAITKTSVTGQSCRQVEADLILSNGGLRREAHVSISTALVRRQDPPGVLVCLEDITHRKLLEAQLRQAQKMEAIGQLAGGVAHDFNNLLAVMRGNVDLLLMGPEPQGEENKDSLKQIVAATERAANLTRQLLAFGRKQVMQAQPFNLNEAIVNLTRMLKRIIGEDTELECDYAAGPIFIHGDVGMIEQVLVNLVVNARDAMPHGGKLRITTARVSRQEDYVQAQPEARVGEFACISVSDVGTGIPPEVLPRIFEPFFTTKGPGKGTGLGLAIVYGIIKQHQGWIEVKSQPGTGTRFDILLPPIPAPVPIASADEANAMPRGGTERILLVEDELTVRTVTQRLLESFGYRVWPAESSKEALEIWRAHASEVNLLLTDIVMPGSLTGRELADQFHQENPQLKVIFMSGYSADVASGDTSFIDQIGGYFLPKPWASRIVLETVRRSLDDNAAPKPGRQ